METTTKDKIKDFTQRILPEQLFKNIKEGADIFDNLDTINTFINNNWNNTFEVENESFDFIHAVRSKRDQYSGSTNILVKLPNISTSTQNNDLVTIVINKNCEETRYFILTELEEHILPKTYVASNQKYLIAEINQAMEYINWGAVVNPRNLAQVSDSIINIQK